MYINDTHLIECIELVINSITYNYNMTYIANKCLEIYTIVVAICIVTKRYLCDNDYSQS